LAEIATDLLLGREVNRVARRIGLQPVRRLYRWCLSPQRIIGLFPDWYAPPQPDWPAQIRLAGFTLFDGSDNSALSADLEDFCRAWPPPIAITFGTGMMHGKTLFRNAVQACAQLGKRGILLTRHDAQLPQPLPHTMRHAAYASFRQLFPRCAAVVHHGGMGTTIQAMAAGLPQVVLPMAWDQPDNAERVQRLGAGMALPSDSNATELAQALERVMKPDTVTRCRVIAGRFAAQNPLELAATWVEEVAAHPA
jgi:rhamnosyltransferase subunit B